MRLGPFEMLHVPGHCAGHVVIRLDDILFSGDHILQRYQPSPIARAFDPFHWGGPLFEIVGAYSRWAKGVRLTLGGHKNPIENLTSGIDANPGDAS